MKRTSARCGHRGTPGSAADTHRTDGQLARSATAPAAQASVWVLHDNPIDLPANGFVTPHPDRVLKGSNSRQRVVTPTRRTPSGRGRHRRACPDKEGTRLALDWRAHDNAPPWARRHQRSMVNAAGRPRPPWLEPQRSQPTHHRLAGNRTPHPRQPAQADRLARCDPHRPRRPADERPTAADEARVREELAQRRIQRALVRAERRVHQKARDAGRAALDGPGHSECRQILAELSERRRQRRYQSDGTRP